MIIKYNGFDIEATVQEVYELMSMRETPKREPVNLKKLDMGKVKALRDAGWSLQKIADDMKVSPTTIHNKLKQEQEGESE